MGAGAIGSLFGGYLAKADQDVTLIGRDWNISPIQKAGLEITPFEGNENIVINLNATTNPKDAGPQDLVIITVKAYDTKTALEDAEPLIADETRILCLQNGYGTEFMAAELYGQSRILRGVTSNGALIEPGHVIHTGFGDTFIGRLDDSIKVDDIIEIFNLTVLKVEFVEKIQEIIWKKVLVNAAINPFGALTNLRNGELLEHEEIVECMKFAVSEGIDVLELHQIKLNKDNSIQNAITVAEMTAANKNSMLQDIEKGRRTEIDYINGAISDLGRRKGVSTPMNYLLTALIKGLERSKNM